MIAETNLYRVQDINSFSKLLHFDNEELIREAATPFLYILDDIRLRILGYQEMSNQAAYSINYLRVMLYYAERYRREGAMDHNKMHTLVDEINRWTNRFGGNFKFSFVIARGFSLQQIRDCAILLREFLNSQIPDNSIVDDKNLILGGLPTIRVMNILAWANDFRIEHRVDSSEFYLTRVSLLMNRILLHEEKDFTEFALRPQVYYPTLFQMRRTWMLDEGIDERFSIISRVAGEKERQACGGWAQLSVDQVIEANLWMFEKTYLGYWFRSERLLPMEDGDLRPAISVCHQLGLALYRASISEQPLDDFKLSYQIFEELRVYGKNMELREEGIEIPTDQAKVMTYVGEMFFEWNFTNSALSSKALKQKILPLNKVDFNFLRVTAVIVPPEFGFTQRDIDDLWDEVELESPDKRLVFLRNLSSSPERDELHNFRTLRFYMIETSSGTEFCRCE